MLQAKEIEIAKDEPSSEEKMESSENSDLEDLEDDESSNEEESKEEKPTSWSNALGAILKVEPKKEKSCVILSRGKKLCEPKPEGNDIPKDKTGETMKKYWISRGRVKPNILERDKEKALQKAAVRGVIHLFNAVHSHQKNVSQDLKKIEKSELKKDVVLKTVDRKKFFDVLMGETTHIRSKPKEAKTEVKIEEEGNKVWGPLREDFMIAAPKLKDWDKKDL